MISKKSLETLKEMYSKEKEEILNQFFNFLRIPSISSEPAFQPHMIECAQWLIQRLEKLGFTVEQWECQGHHPVIFATHLHAGDDKPTLLIYNHYDVQPVDPLEDWISPPFEPTIRNGEIYARGAVDDKGQCYYVLQAIRLLLERDGKLPVNIKWCIEGEEECSSRGLANLLKTEKDCLKADYLAIVDSGMNTPETPAVTLGARGIITMDVCAQGSTVDLHSGANGGVTFNPIHALVEVLSKLRDADGRVTIPGFYDDVVEMPDAEKQTLALNFDAAAYEKMFGAKATGGEKGFSPLEREWLRPTIEVNGITGGYRGDGFKTVIPAKASAKVSCRLVPNQQPAVMAKRVAKYIESLAPAGIKLEVKLHEGGGEAVRTTPNSKVAQAFAAASLEVFGKPCEYLMTGGSIPIVAELTRISGAEMVLVGVGLPDDLIHAPNEHFGVDRLEKGTLVTARAIEILGQGHDTAAH